MRDALEAITETVRKVVGRVNPPLSACTEMIILLQDAIRSHIPHLRVGVVDVLLHAKRRLLRLVFAISHSAELS